MNMVFTMGFRVQIFGRRCALEPAFFFIKRQYTEQLTDKQGEQFWAVSTCQKQYSFLAGESQRHIAKSLIFEEPDVEYRGHYSRQFLDRQSRRLPVRRDWQQHLNEPFSELTLG